MTTARRKPSLTLCCVRWHDACKRDGVFTKDEVQGRRGDRMARVELYTAGWLVTRSKHTLTLAKDYEPEEEEWRDLMHIPHGMIRSVKTFKYPAHRKRSRE